MTDISGMIYMYVSYYPQKDLGLRHFKMPMILVRIKYVIIIQMVSKPSKKYATGD